MLARISCVFTPSVYCVNKVKIRSLKSVGGLQFRCSSIFYHDQCILGNAKRRGRIATNVTKTASRCESRKGTVVPDIDAEDTDVANLAKALRLVLFNALV